MRRSYWFVIVGAVLLLAANFAYWQTASERLRSGVQAWIGARSAAGWTVHGGPLTIGGWPFSARVSLPEITMHHAGSDIPGKVDWKGQDISLSIALLHPTVVDVAFHGPQSLGLGDVPTMTISGDGLAVSVALLPKGAFTADIRANSLLLQSATWRATAGMLAGRADMARVGDTAVPGVTFSGNVVAIALPGTVKWPLGPNISSLAVSGRLNGPLPDVSGMKTWADAWRDGGGSLEVKHLTLGWGPLGFTSSATLALDDQLQPMGSGSARVVGYAETLDRLAAAGVLTKSASTVAKAVLSLLAGGGEGDTQSAVDVPLSLQYRTLSMRQVPLARLPELDWPSR